MKIRNKIILITTFLAFAISGMSQSFSEISKKISKYEYKIGIRKTSRDYFYEIRKKVSLLGKLSFIEKSDTLFLLEKYDVENGFFYVKIWNKFDKIDFIYNNDRLDFNVSRNYTDYTCKLIQNWDTVSIRFEEKVNSLMSNPANIYGTRFIKNKCNPRIDCILFKEFFNLERDRQ